MYVLNDSKSKVEVEVKYILNLNLNSAYLYKDQTYLFTH